MANEKKKRNWQQPARISDEEFLNFIKKKSSSWEKLIFLLVMIRTSISSWVGCVKKNVDDADFGRFIFIWLVRVVILSQVELEIFWWSYIYLSILISNSNLKFKYYKRKNIKHLLKYLWIFNSPTWANISRSILDADKKKWNWNRNVTISRHTQNDQLTHLG